MLEVYASKTSVIAGSPTDIIEFFAGDEMLDYTQVQQVSLELTVTKRGAASASFTVSVGIATNVTLSKAPVNAYLVGCQWPLVGSFPIPANWSSGVYDLTLYATAGASAGQSASVSFVVKGSSSSQATILIVCPYATKLAYNNWQDPANGGSGKNFYDASSSENVFSPRLNLHRPGLGVGDDADDIINWVHMHGLDAAVDYATSYDLQDYTLLDRYRLLVYVGHEEYWSSQMRDTVEGFVANGGNVCFFTGNTCWWQVRFEDYVATYLVPNKMYRNAIIVCYKGDNGSNGRPGPDPLANTPFNTTHWLISPPGRPESIMTGLTSWGGAAWNSPPPRDQVQGYVASYPRYWIYTGATLPSNFVFGDDAVYSGAPSGVGWEVDSTDSYTPGNFILLASTNELLRLGFPWYELRDNLPPQPQTTAYGQMGLYRRNGTVFSVGNILWTTCLPHGGVVSQITLNLFSRLAERNNAALPVSNMGFERWASLTAPDGWNLEGSGSVQSGTKAPANKCLVIDAAQGETWISYSPLLCSNQLWYRVGCWVNSYQPGATIRLQSNTILPGNIGGIDFVLSNAHPGDGLWHYLCAVGKPDPREATRFQARVKLQVPGGVLAQFDDVLVENLHAINGNWDKGVSIANAGFEIWSSAVPDSWNLEGSGSVHPYSPAMDGAWSLAVDATVGQTWISQPLTLFERRTYYRVGCWAMASSSGATIRLQSDQILSGNIGGVDYVIAEHSGGGEWEYIWAVGYASDDEGVMFDARVKIQVGVGVIAYFDDVSVDIVGSLGNSGELL